jgi:dual specificity MAP kinase phosphatase
MLDISQITTTLNLSGWPHADDRDAILKLDIRLILSMHWARPARLLTQPPLKLLWLPTFDHPYAPIPMRVLHRGVKAALPVINEGHGVLVHCHYGIHRSVAMACCVLIGSGYTADDAMQLVKAQRAVADPDASYIQVRIRKFAEEWLHNKEG